MSKVAYTLAEAAETTATSEATISEAIRCDQLIARVAGERVIISHPALKRWVKSLIQFRP